MKGCTGSDFLFGSRGGFIRDRLYASVLDLLHSGHADEFIMS
jgi:hypothetical protein